MSAKSIQAGQMIDGYQVQAQAPVEFIRGSRSRYLGGHRVSGAWSDPWWAYAPERGWVVVKRWRSKAQKAWNGVDRETRRSTFAGIPARDEIVIEPYESAQ